MGLQIGKTAVSRDSIITHICVSGMAYEMKVLV
jgi:hypothetical protein